MLYAQDTGNAKQEINLSNLFFMIFLLYFVKEINNTWWIIYKLAIEQLLNNNDCLSDLIVLYPISFYFYLITLIFFGFS